MSERYTTRENDPTKFTAYYGTTLENYRTCAQISDSGVVFAKKQEERHVEPEATRFIYGLIGGARYAFTRAKELGHTPLVLEGELDKDTYYFRGELLPGEAFPVKQVWVPREDVDWRTYNRFVDHSEEAPETHRVF